MKYAQYASLVVAAALAIVLDLTAPAFAEKRIALLVANQLYVANVGPLNNPMNDVGLVEASLKDDGFEVTVVHDVDRIDLLRAIDKYAEKIAASGKDTVSFFYYVGHGVARPSDHINYLIPVDVRDMSDDRVWYMTVPLDTVLDTLTQKAPDAVHFVVFDACRNELHVPSAGRAPAAIAESKAFVPVMSRNGQFIAFSTSPKETATDAGQTGGPYAIALASELKRSGQDHLSLFQNVRERVFAATQADPLQKGQRPMEIGSLLQRVFFSSPGLPTQIVVPQRTPADVANCADSLNVASMTAVDAIALYKKCLKPS